MQEVPRRRTSSIGAVVVDRVPPCSAREAMRVAQRRRTSRIDALIVKRAPLRTARVPPRATREAMQEVPRRRTSSIDALIVKRAPLRTARVPPRATREAMQEVSRRRTSCSDTPPRSSVRRGSPSRPLRAIRAPHREGRGPRASPAAPLVVRRGAPQRASVTRPEGGRARPHPRCRPSTSYASRQGARSPREGGRVPLLASVASEVSWEAPGRGDGRRPLPRWRGRLGVSASWCSAVDSSTGLLGPPTYVHRRRARAPGRWGRGPELGRREARGQVAVVAVPNGRGEGDLTPSVPGSSNLVTLSATA
jgi:hypothetical protein